MASKLLAGSLILLVSLAIFIAAVSIFDTQGEARENDWFNTKSPSGKCYEVFQKSRGSVGYHFVMFQVTCE